MAAPSALRSVAVAVDLGGTKLDVALVSPDGTLLPGSRARRPTGPGTDAEALRAALRGAAGDALSALPDGVAVVGVGIGAAGPIDRTEGTIRPVNLVGLHGFALREAVAETVRGLGLEAPVHLGHDGGCLALAEAWLGAAAAARASLSIVVSTGIGGGYVVGGRLVTGASGNAGHIGQMRAGGSGADGGLTLEEVAAGPGSVAWARAQGWTGTTGVELGVAVAQGEPVARAAVERSARAVGATLADAVALLDVDVVAIGGGFSRVTPDYIDLVGASLREHAALDFVRTARVVPVALGDDAPLVGAAALVWR